MRLTKFQVTGLKKFHSYDIFVIILHPFPTPTEIFIEFRNESGLKRFVVFLLIKNLAYMLCSCLVFGLPSMFWAFFPLPLFFLPLIGLELVLAGEGWGEWVAGGGADPATLPSGRQDLLAPSPEAPGSCLPCLFPGRGTRHGSTVKALRSPAEKVPCLASLPPLLPLLPRPWLNSRQTWERPGRGAHVGTRNDGDERAGILFTWAPRYSHFLGVCRASQS